MIFWGYHPTISWTVSLLGWREIFQSMSEKKWWNAPTFFIYALWFLMVSMRLCTMEDMSLRGSSSCQLVDWEWEIKMRWDTHILENKPNSAINSTYVDEEKSDMVLKMHNVKKITCMLYSKCFKTSIITQPIPHPTITTNVSLFYCSLSFIHTLNIPKVFSLSHTNIQEF